MTAVIRREPESQDEFNYGSRQEREKPSPCVITEGIPEEGLGQVYSGYDDPFRLSLTAKEYSLQCDHEGPQTQQCRLLEGGYVTWVEESKRLHIKASTGYVNVVMRRGVGVRCE